MFCRRDMGGRVTIGPTAGSGYTVARGAGPFRLTLASGLMVNAEAQAVALKPAIVLGGGAAGIVFGFDNAERAARTMVKFSSDVDSILDWGTLGGSVDLSAGVGRDDDSSLLRRWGRACALAFGAEGDATCAAWFSERQRSLP